MSEDSWNYHDYVEREEFNQLEEKVKRLEETLTDLKALLKAGGQLEVSFTKAREAKLEARRVAREKYVATQKDRLMDEATRATRKFILAQLGWTDVAEVTNLPLKKLRWIYQAIVRSYYDGDLAHLKIPYRSSFADITARQLLITSAT